MMYWLRCRDCLNTPAEYFTAPCSTRRGGVVDDMIVYLMPSGYRLIVNAATRDQDLAWMNAQSQGYAVNLLERPELALLAIQGPQAWQKWPSW